MQFTTKLKYIQQTSNWYITTTATNVSSYYTAIKQKQQFNFQRLWFVLDYALRHCCPRGQFYKSLSLSPDHKSLFLYGTTSPCPCPLTTNPYPCTTSPCPCLWTTSPCSYPLTTNPCSWTTTLSSNLMSMTTALWYSLSVCCCGCAAVVWDGSRVRPTSPVVRHQRSVCSSLSARSSRSTFWRGLVHHSQRLVSHWSIQAVFPLLQ